MVLTVSKSESQIQKEILKWLSCLPKFEIFAWRNYVGPIVRGSGDSKFYTKNPCPGRPDIEAVIYGRYVGLEVKTKKGHLSQAQITFKSRIEKVGGFYFVVRSLDDAMGVIEMVREMHPTIRKGESNGYGIVEKT